MKQYQREERQDYEENLAKRVLAAMFRQAPFMPIILDRGSV
jgi:hypothetical protein